VVAEDGGPSARRAHSRSAISGEDSAATFWWLRCAYLSHPRPRVPAAGRAGYDAARQAVTGGEAEFSLSLPW